MSIFYLLSHVPVGISKEGDGDDFALELDLSIAERHIYSSDVTENPVENGGMVSDHIINRPVLVHMTGFVTNTPNSLLKIAKTFTTPTLDAFDALKKIHEDALPVDIVTNLTLYESVAITELVFPQDRENVNSMTIDITFKTINIVNEESNEDDEQDAGSQ